MTKRSLVIAVLSALCITTILAVPTNSLVGYYDPWLDYDENGNIDMKDVAASARAFGSFGDPTKNVSVTNWPVSSQVPVWWDIYLPPSGSIFGYEYSSSGFTRIHILAIAYDLEPGESMEIGVWGVLTSPTGMKLYVEAYTFTLTSTSDTRDQTIFVPSETFKFRAATDAASDGRIYLGFYLTWA